MNFFDLLDIGDAEIDILSPITAERILKLGEYLGLNSKSRIIDFGCGKGELLTLWAKEFGIKGLGVDIREIACRAAADKIKSLKLTKQITISQGRTVEFQFPEKGFDYAVCIASSFTWGGYREALNGMKNAIKENGKVVIGEPYWVNDDINFSRVSKEPFFTEPELWELSRNCGFDFEYLYRASREDIDRYESELWRSYLKWIDANPDHPDLQKVIDHFHKIQKEYLQFDRINLGWAVYVLNPIKYKSQKAMAFSNVLAS